MKFYIEIIILLIILFIFIIWRIWYIYSTRTLRKKYEQSQNVKQQEGGINDEHRRIASEERGIAEGTPGSDGDGRPKAGHSLPEATSEPARSDSNSSRGFFRPRRSRK